MASPNMLALRKEMAALQPREVVLDVPRRSPSGVVAVAAQMRRASLLRHLHTKRRVAQSNASGRDGLPRAIPVGGPGRRRAKANRNRAAVEASEEAAGRGPRVTTADRLGDWHDANEAAA
jgi:hypothetical protein